MNPSSSQLCMMSHQMTTASQMEICMCQRTVALVNRLRLLTQRESHQLSLLSWLVQANVEEFTPCHEEWQNPRPSKTSTEIKVCTTCLPKPLKARQMKTSSMVPSSTSKADEEPYCLLRRNDGWCHVSSTSAQTAQCKRICASCH